jgi:hypothetical protein
VILLAIPIGLVIGLIVGASTSPSDPRPRLR